MILKFVLYICFAALIYLVIIFTYGMICAKRGEKPEITKEVIISEALNMLMFGIVFGGLAYVFSNIQNF